jgi:hypothetical protein
MYKLIIGETKENKKNVFQFDLIFMSGDGDAYETSTCFIDKEDEYLQRFTDFVFSCLGKSDIVPVDKQIFVENCIRREAFNSSEELQNFFKRNLIFHWPVDCCTSSDYSAKLDEINVTFFNELGQAYFVTIEKK